MAEDSPNISGGGGMGGSYGPEQPNIFRNVVPIPNPIEREASSELIEKRKAVCITCSSFRDENSKPPYPQPFCTQRCGSYLKHKWGNEAAKCCIGKW